MTAVGIRTRSWAEVCAYYDGQRDLIISMYRLGLIDQDLHDATLARIEGFRAVSTALREGSGEKRVS